MRINSLFPENIKKKSYLIYILLAFILGTIFYYTITFIIKISIIIGIFLFKFIKENWGFALLFGCIILYFIAKFRKKKE